MLHFSSIKSCEHTHAFLLNSHTIICISNHLIKINSIPLTDCCSISWFYNHSGHQNAVKLSACFSDQLILTFLK